jgi:hypothetical protein
MQGINTDKDTDKKFINTSVMIRPSITNLNKGPVTNGNAGMINQSYR